MGWQSYSLFFVSLVVGLRGNFTKKSTALAVAYGISGTFLINIVRMAFTAALVGWWKGLFVILFHNYCMTFVTISWLFFVFLLVVLLWVRIGGKGRLRNVTF